MSESLRERLMNRRRPSATCRIRVDDTASATKALEQAVVGLRLLRGSGEDDLAQAQAAVREAQEALEACYQPLTLLALRPPDFEALVAAHPPREGTDDIEWNVDTFGPALFRACAQGDMTDADWDAWFVESCSDGEEAALYQAALAINVRAPEGTIPKELTRMLD
ncbi:hypothetical protein [Streptosporangium sp. NPDC048865]|uniref:hypothetical protein n=1 Tax=Streptosporangium sp. NPDC048865 TaxID=3155766 RepID=UPI0034418D19